MKSHVKIILDKRRKREDGAYRIAIRLTHNRIPLILGLDYVCEEENWDDEHSLIKPECKLHSNLTRVNNSIAAIKSSAISTVDILNTTGEIKNLSATELKYKILNQSVKASFKQFNSKIIDELKKAKKLGNASCYEQAQAFLDRYSGKTELYFHDINFKLLKKMETEHIAKGHTYNSLSFYLRTIRAVFNRAIKEGLIKRDVYPFANYSIKETKTVKRAIRKADIDKIRDVKLKKGTYIWHARNFFMFSFYNIGMNFADIAHLKKINIIDGRMVYTRMKTGKSYSVKLTDPAKKILSYYIKDKEPKDFIFPILKRTTPELQFKDLVNERKTYNKYLKKIAGELKMEVNLTSYVARHSWATIAKDLNVPVSVISEGLGHEDIKTTQIYLDSFDDDVIDQANLLITGK